VKSVGGRRQGVASAAWGSAIRIRLLPLLTGAIAALVLVGFVVVGPAELPGLVPVVRAILPGAIGVVLAFLKVALSLTRPCW